jgi:predicted nucleic-acid-binding protein
MIGLDTNVLVRFLVRDHEEQFERAQRLIRREAQAGVPVLVSHLVLLETEWVLRSRYKLSKAEILGAFSDLMSAVDLNFEDEPALEEALFAWKNSSIQFADCLIGARYGTLACSATATFDADAVKLPGFIAA